MANKKRDTNGYKKQLGRYRLEYSDLLALEKLLWIYADAREMKFAGITELPEGRGHMPRAAIDRHVSMGRYRPFHITVGWNELGIHFAGVDWIYREDSVKFLKERGYSRKTRYFQLSAWPGIHVTFTPRTTTIYAQTHYATGRELRVMRDVIKRIEAYLAEIRRARYNLLSLDSI